MSVIIKDDGFHESTKIHYDNIMDIWIEPSDNLERIDFKHAGLISIHFPSFADGRGFGLARSLRAQGYNKKLRAVGHLIADQYAMARRVGFDEIEISDEMSKRQDASQWLNRANWREFDYQSRLGQEVEINHE